MRSGRSGLFCEWRRREDRRSCGRVFSRIRGLVERRSQIARAADVAFHCSLYAPAKASEVGVPHVILSREFHTVRATL